MFISQEHLTNLPYIAAMLILMAVLFALQRRKPRLAIGSWLVALSFILVSQISWYFVYNDPDTSKVIHTIRITADTLAGIVFLLYTGFPLAASRRRNLTILLNAVPFVALEIIFGLYLPNHKPYEITALAAILIACAVATGLRNHWIVPASLTALWLLISAITYTGDLRGAAYFGLGAIYLLACVHLWRKLRRAPIGRVAVTGSLATWAFLFFTHSWMLHTRFREMTDNLWNLQRYFITIGLLLVLLEDEMRTNEFLALHDQLTGLPNRRLMEPRLLEAMAAGPVDVILLDLNGFKQVNDTYGHAAGDEILRQVATRLRDIAGPKDTLVRMGGDEFLVIARSKAASLIDAIRIAVPQPVQLDETTSVSIDLSIGRSSYPQDAEGRTGSDALSHLVRVADSRMYAIKHESQPFRNTRGKERRKGDRRLTGG